MFYVLNFFSNQKRGNKMTQLEKVRKNKITKEIKYVAKQEGIGVNVLKEKIINGSVVIPANINHKNLKPIGIGSGLKIKVNANIGASPIKSNLEEELQKLDTALKAGADTIMDLTVTKNSKDIDKIRKTIIKNCYVPLGTVPIYQAAIEASGPENMTLDNYLKVFEKHARDGVDFVTVHSGITKDVFPFLKNRLMECVSRGGSFILKWMKYNNKENFLYKHFGKILDIAREYDITLSLGDGLRPGCIDDATDEAQIHELKRLGELAQRAREKNVQVMIEGPGHIPLNEIEKNVELEKKICNGIPFYVLGPLPTDITIAYDHIACAIGGALAAWKGADFLCYVTPKEHIGLPDIDDIREGTIVTKIAAHIADIAKGNEKAISRNYKMARARKEFNWDEMLKYAIDQEKFATLRKQECEKNPQLENVKYCSMCGDFCALQTKVVKTKHK